MACLVLKIIKKLLTHSLLTMNPNFPIKLFWIVPPQQISCSTLRRSILARSMREDGLSIDLITSSR